MSNSFMDPDQARRFVGPDLGPNCLPRLSADDTGRQRVNDMFSNINLLGYLNRLRGVRWPSGLVSDSGARSQTVYGVFFSLFHSYNVY